MCFHNEGIVMQEYELYNTTDLPKLTGFDKEQILRIMRNLALFLKNNATQEGHTYWLVKEPGFDVVKLYDLTVLCEKSDAPNACHEFEGDKEENGGTDGSCNGKHSCAFVEFLAVLVERLPYNKPFFFQIR